MNVGELLLSHCRDISSVFTFQSYSHFVQRLLLSKKAQAFFKHHFLQILAQKQIFFLIQDTELDVQIDISLVSLQ